MSRKSGYRFCEKGRAKTKSEREELSCAQQIEGALDHAARRADDIEVGLVGTLRLAHVVQFDDRIDVRIFHVAVLVRGRMPGLEFGAEGGRVLPCLAHRDGVGLKRAI